jgi:NAD(P)-dependent dehydrogenase (short-subunit alcohol dehydrogenase family)
MKELRGRTAVVTGAASGIGRGMATVFAREGMKLVLADVEVEPLEATQEELRGAGAEVLAVPTDVSSAEAVQALAARTSERFGTPHLLCNNAGVGTGLGPLWLSQEADWRWVIDVNLMGVVHGIQAFVPGMLEGGEEGHVVNTSSVLGLNTGPGGIYPVVKHALTRLTEGLHHELRAAGSKLGVSVLCPGAVDTRILEAERNRPRHLGGTGEVPPHFLPLIEAIRKEFEPIAMAPERVGELVLEAIREERFYILTHPEVKSEVEERARAIVEDRDPPASSAPG